LSILVHVDDLAWNLGPCLLGGLLLGEGLSLRLLLLLLAGRMLLHLLALLHHVLRMPLGADGAVAVVVLRGLFGGHQLVVELAVVLLDTVGLAKLEMSLRLSLGLSLGLVLLLVGGHLLLGLQSDVLDLSEWGS